MWCCVWESRTYISVKRKVMTIDTHSLDYEQDNRDRRHVGFIFDKISRTIIPKAPVVLE